METEGDCWKFKDRFTFAGPKEEMDKLASIKWNMISIEHLSDSSTTELHTPLRLSDNSLSLESVNLQPIEDWILHPDPQ